MNPRVQYEMSEADLKHLLDACKPTVAIMVGRYAPPSPQENANAAWAALGAKMGFDSLTVRPESGKGMRCFTAVPSETPEQRAERVAQQEKDAREFEIARIRSEMDRLRSALAELEKIR